MDGAWFIHSALQAGCQGFKSPRLHQRLACIADCRLLAWDASGMQATPRTGGAFAATMPGQHQVPGAADRQKLGQALNYSQYYPLNRLHKWPFSAISTSNGGAFCAAYKTVRLPQSPAVFLDLAKKFSFLDWKLFFLPSTINGWTQINSNNDYPP